MRNEIIWEAMCWVETEMRESSIEGWYNEHTEMNHTEKIRILEILEEEYELRGILSSRDFFREGRILLESKK